MIYFNLDIFGYGFILGMGLTGLAGITGAMYKSARRIFHDVSK